MYISLDLFSYFKCLITTYSFAADSGCLWVTLTQANAVTWPRHTDKYIRIRGFHVSQRLSLKDYA